MFELVLPHMVNMLLQLEPYLLLWDLHLSPYDFLLQRSLVPPRIVAILLSLPFQIPVGMVKLAVS